MGAPVIGLWRLLQRAGIAAALAAAAGCGATSENMRPAAAALPLKAPDGAALVVFLRPSDHAAAMKATVVDENGKFLGDSLARSYFAVPVVPGDHLFVAWAENSAGLKATVAAGKTYYVEVAPGLGALSAKLSLFALAPRTEHWKDLAAWLADATPFELVAGRGDAALATLGTDVRDRVQQAGEELKRYDADEMSLHVLRADDGQ